MNKTNVHIQTKTYKLQKGDTIYSVADKFDIQVNELRKFHNDNSSLSNRIPYTSDIPNHIMELMLPAVYVKKDELPIELENQNSLNCDFRLLKHTYGVVIRIETKNKSSRINYTTKIECFKEFEFMYNMTIAKGQVYIDYKAPNMLAENLATSLAKPLYPLDIKVNSIGRIMEVTNQPEIYKRWEAEKPKIKRYYKSSIVDQQIEVIDKAYQNVAAIEKVLQRDIFFKLYFSGIYNKYFNVLEIDNKLRLPLYTFINGIEYRVKQNIHPFLNLKGNIVMRQKGFVCDLRSSVDIQQSKDEPYYKGTPLSGELDITYELCREKHIIKSIIGEITLFLNKELDKKIKIEAYQLI